MAQHLRWRVALFIVLVVLLSAGLAACGDDDKDEGGLTINDPWVRPTITMADDSGDMDGNDTDDGDMNDSDASEGDMDAGDMAHSDSGMVTGVFMTIENTSKAADTLVSASVSADVATMVEIHETTIDENDVMQMRPVEGIEIPAEGNAVLKPGSYHIMLLDVQQSLEVGDTVDITLTFESGTEIEVGATVRALE